MFFFGNNEFPLQEQYLEQECRFSSVGHQDLVRTPVFFKNSLHSRKDQLLSQTGIFTKRIGKRQDFEHLLGFQRFHIKLRPWIFQGDTWDASLLRGRRGPYK